MLKTLFFIFPMEHPPFGESIENECFKTFFGEPLSKSEINMKCTPKMGKIWYIIFECNWFLGNKAVFPIFLRFAECMILTFHLKQFQVQKYVYIYMHIYALFFFGALFSNQHLGRSVWIANRIYQLLGGIVLCKHV